MEAFIQSFLKNTQAVDVAARYVKMHNNIIIYL